MQVLRDEMERFAKDTRHRPRQYETEEQTAHVLRKMIAAHIRCVPWDNVYLHVSPGDYNRVKERIKPARIEDRAPPSPEFFQALGTQAIPTRACATGLLADYGDAIGETDEPGNVLSLYLCRASKGDVRMLCNALYTTNSVKREHVYDQVVSSAGYVKHPAESTNVVARDLGSLISSLAFESITDGSLYLSTAGSAPSLPLGRSMDSVPSPATGIVFSEAPTEQVEWSMHGWKEHQVLSPLFSDKNAAKQLFVVHHAPEATHLLEKHQALGRFQQLGDLASAPTTAIAAASAYQSLVAQAAPAAVQRLWDTPTIQKYVQHLCSTTPAHQLASLSKQDILGLYMQQKHERLPFPHDLLEAIVQA